MRKVMKILMGTKNKGKIEGARQAFLRYFENVEIEGYPVSSDVSEEPLNSEIIEGAQNRVKNLKKYAKENGIEADFYIASEAGLFNTFGRWMDTNLALIEDKNGFQSIGISSGFPMSKKYEKEVIETDLRSVFRKIFEKANLNQEGGGINYLTDEVVTRVKLTEQAFTMALIEHRKDYWRE
jgi:inosine/xanthosine triphosphatase